jgi:hypothetical protein
MCVAAISEEMMNEANVTVTSDFGVQVKIEHDGMVISDNRYIITDNWDGDVLNRQVSRLMSTGQAYQTNLTFSSDYYPIGIPDVEVKGIGQMTLAEVGLILNAFVPNYKYVLTSSETDKWGYTTKATFREASKVQREAVEAKREEQSRKLADALIR